MSEDPPVDDPARAADDHLVALAVADAGNRQQLREWFADRGYEVVVPEAAADFGRSVDLCVVDAGGYGRHEERLSSLKDSVAPTFLPYLFVADDERALSEPTVWERFDEAVVTPLRPGELAGRVDGLLSRRELSREVTASERRFRTLFQSTPDPIVAVADGSVIDVNVGFCRLTGTDRETAIGRPLSSLPGLSAAAADTVTAVLSGSAKGRDATVSFVDADGQQRVAEVEVARVEDADYAIITFRDVSEQLLRQRELRRQTQRLDEFAEVLDASLREALHRVADAVDDGDVDGEAALAAASRAEELVDELLALSATGDVVSSPQSVDLDDVVRDAWADLPPAGAELAVDLEGGQRVTADPSRLQEGLAHLFGVVVDRGATSVAVQRATDGFDVVTDGPPMDDAERERLLQPGTDAAGDAMGLALLEEVVLVHGWDLSIDDVDGGVAFRFRSVALPRAPDDEGEDADAAAVGEVSVSRPAETLQTTIHYMERLYEVTSLEDVPFEQKVSHLLELGTERFGLPNGFLTRIDDGTQNIVHATGEHPLLQPGESCSLDEAYCRKTIEADEPLSVPDALADGWKDDPAYDTFQLGAYVGSKVSVDGDLYGTLCFAATTPRNTRFSDAERTFIELMAQWVGREIERHRRRSELERQLQRLDRFASVVSHDLRNPLNVAMGNVDAALEADDPRPSLEHASDALDRMARLIEDLLTLAREGETVDEPEPTRLSDRVHAAWAMVEDDDATVTVATDGSLDADPERLEQLLGNLFRNAVEHGGEDGGVAVTVGATDEGFYVADDGPGIPADEREEVFRSGFTTSTDGTGFGLAIVAEIAEAHGWSVSVEESETGGAKFVVAT